MVHRPEEAVKGLTQSLVKKGAEVASVFKPPKERAKEVGPVLCQNIQNSEERRMFQLIFLQQVYWSSSQWPEDAANSSYTDITESSMMLD